ncbi:MAG TPA: DUF2071 domain-containing protein [Chloroflexota bacterium]|nr:DUF2071 domain-containing protein [Chloroflexota bacterium]
MIPVPTIAGTIERRLLLNYRVEGEVIARLLPSPFRPQLIQGMAVAGICMIRLGHLRPCGLPGAIGLTTENAAHRIAVEWDTADGPCHGVYIPRRDTSSRLTVLAGGRLFPGEQHRARFTVRETEQRFEVAFTSIDGAVHVGVAARLASGLLPGSVFPSAEAASRFFEESPLGYSATKDDGRLEALELECEGWSAEPLAVEHAESSYFEDESLFPKGSVQFDSALVMRDIPTRWRARTELAGSQEPSAPRTNSAQAALSW